MNDIVQANGYVDLTLRNLDDGTTKQERIKNTVLMGGKTVLAKALSQIYEEYDFFIDKMVFGSGGKSGSSIKTIDPSATTSLFHQEFEIAAVNGWDIDYPNMARFTGTIGSATPGYTLDLNEMGLMTSSGQLFSMVTFSGFTKSSSIEFTLNWTIVFA